MGRFDYEGVTYETRGSQQGAALARALDALGKYNRKRRQGAKKPEIKFHRTNLPYNHLHTFDMHNHVLNTIKPQPKLYFFVGFFSACIVGSKVAALIYDKDLRYKYLVRYPKQMRFFDECVEGISSRFWKIGHDYFGGFIIPNIQSEHGFYNFVYGVKNKVFQIEKREQQAQIKFEQLKAVAIQSDTDVQTFDSAVQQQDKDLKRKLIELEREQEAKQSSK